MEEKRKLLNDLYNQCTQGEQDKFNQMYKSIDDIKDEQVDMAIYQCKNTLNRPHHVAKRKISERNNKIDDLID